jgi:hypothetical protein
MSWPATSECATEVLITEACRHHRCTNSIDEADRHQRQEIMRVPGPDHRPTKLRCYYSQLLLLPDKLSTGSR